MRIASNTFYSLAQLGLARLAGVVTLIALSWTQGAETVGVFSLALTYHILLTGWWVGIDDKVVREIARHRALVDDPADSRRFTWHMVLDYLRLKGGVGLVLAPALAALVWWSGWYAPQASLFILLLIASSLSDNAVLALIAGYAGNERFALASALVLLQTVLRIGLMAAALFSDAGLVMIAGAWLAASVVTMLLALALFVAQYRPARAERDVAAQRPPPILRLREDWSFVSMGIVVMLEYQLDIILLSYFHRAGEVGYYGVGTTLFGLATLPVQAFRMAVYPAMSRMAVRDGGTTYGAPRSEALQQLYAWSVSSVLALALLCVLLGVAFAQPAIALVFGPAMQPAVVPTQILMATVVLVALNVPHSRLLLSTGQQDKAAQFITVSAVVNVLANLWLGPWLGATGAAIARAISTATFLGLAAYRLRGFAHRANARWSLAPLCAAAATTVFLLLTGAWPWWLAAGVALLLYGAVWWFVSERMGTRVLTG